MMGQFSCPNRTADTRADRGCAQLIATIGEAATIALAESFGGTRLYIPASVRDVHRLTRAIGRTATQALCERFGSTVIRVPLARDLRAESYRAEGLSNSRIAARLGITESGVASLFKRLEKGRSGEVSRDPRRLAK